MTATQYDEDQACWEDTVDGIPDFPWNDYYRHCTNDIVWVFREGDGRRTVTGGYCEGRPQRRIMRRARLVSDDGCTELWDDAPHCSGLEP